MIAVAEGQREAVLSSDAARMLLDQMTAHDRLLRSFGEMHLDRIRSMQRLGDREDTPARARRRADELPTHSDLEEWYRSLQSALNAKPDREIYRRLVVILMSSMRGRPDGDLVIESFVIAIEDAALSPRILAGAVKRAWLQFKTKPSLQAFMKVCSDHKAEVQRALDDVVRTMGLRRDAEKIADKL